MKMVCMQAVVIRPQRCGEPCAGTVPNSPQDPAVIGSVPKIAQRDRRRVVSGASSTLLSFGSFGCTRTLNFSHWNLMCIPPTKTPTQLDRRQRHTCRILLVTVVLGLEGSVLGHADVGRLFRIKFGQLHTNAIKMQTRNFLVQMFWQDVNA